MSPVEEELRYQVWFNRNAVKTSEQRPTKNRYITTYQTPTMGEGEIEKEDFWDAYSKEEIIEAIRTI